MSFIGKFTKGATVGAAMLALPFAAAAQEYITLGSAISLTGKYSTNGVHAKNGYDFAIDKINAAGGVTVGGKTYKLRVIYYDDESTPARGAQLAERLISQDEVQFMLGPYSSGLTKAVAPVTEKYGIPMVEAEGASRSLFNKGYRYLFAVLSTSEQYLATTIALAAGVAEKAGQVALRGARRAGLRERSVQPGRARRACWRMRRSSTCRSSSTTSFPRDLSDMAATLIKVKALKPDVLIVSGHSKGAATAVRQIGEMDVKVPMLAVTHCESADVVGKFGDTANGVLCATQWAETLTYSDPFFGTAAEYEAEFKGVYPEYAAKSVPYQTAQATAAVWVFKDAFERAGSLDKEAERDALAATDLMTFYGGIRFSEAGNNVAKPMVLRQIQDGKLNVVAPPEFASHPLDWPRE